MVDQLDANFRNLSDADFIIKMEGIVEKLAAHPGYPLPWPAEVPDPEALEQQLANFKIAIAAAAAGDRRKSAEYKGLRKLLETSALFVSQYLVMKSFKEKDPDRLLNTGFILKARKCSRREQCQKPGTWCGDI